MEVYLIRWQHENRLRPAASEPAIERSDSGPGSWSWTARVELHNDVWARSDSSPKSIPQLGRGRAPCQLRTPRISSEIAFASRIRSGTAFSPSSLFNRKAGPETEIAIGKGTSGTATA